MLHTPTNFACLSGRGKTHTTVQIRGPSNVRIQHRVSRSKDLGGVNPAHTNNRKTNVSGEFHLKRKGSFILF